MKSRLQIVFLLLVLAAVGQTCWQHGRLPARVATHFDGAGRANGWLSRDAHAALHLATILFVVALIQGIAFFNGRLPKEYVNLPNRDYWLAPDRAAATHAWIRSVLLFMGCALMLFFMGLFHLVYRANFATPAKLGPGIWWLTAGLLATVAGAIVVMVARFRKPAA